MASGAGFARILNMTTLFGKMKKELESRLNYSEFYNKTLSLAIETEKEKINLLVNSGEITVSTDEQKADCTVETSLSSLNPLVTGYKNIYELVQKKKATINCSRASAQDLNRIRLVDVFFPKGTPYGSNLPLVWE